MIGRFRCAAVAVVAALTAAGVAAAQDSRLLSDRTPAERPQLMVVGVAHFDNPGKDVVNTHVEDLLTPSRQAQIRASADALARFKPTHVVVEWPASKQAKLDARYQAYLKGDYVLTRDEVDQLGLRIARQLGLPRVDAGDWNEEPPGVDADYDFEAWPKAADAAARLAALRDPKNMHEEPLAGRTVARWLAALNTPEHLALMNRRYFDFAMLGDGTRDPGANWVAAWYGRNLKIFDRLVRLADKPADRVLVIFGAGHAFLLQQDADQSHAFRVVSPEPLLLGAR